MTPQGLKDSCQVGDVRIGSLDRDNAHVVTMDKGSCEYANMLIVNYEGHMD